MALLHVHRPTDRLEEANRRFLQFNEVLKNKYNLSHKICVMLSYYIRLLLLLLLCAFLNTLQIVIFVINY